MLRIAFTGQNSAYDRLPGPSAQVADHIRQLHIHLGQDLLHPLDAGADGLDVVAVLTPINSRGPNLGSGVERVAQEPVGVQLQQPLTFLHVSLPPWEIARISRVHQIDLEAFGIQYLVQRNPVDPRGFHGIHNQMRLTGTLRPDVSQ